MFEDDRPKPKTIDFPRKLDLLSISELEEYISLLRQEIGRCEADIIKKKASRDAAASVFKS